MRCRALDPAGPSGRVLPMAQAKLTSTLDSLRDAVDRYQQQHSWAGLPFAVVKKYGDDEGGRHAALMTYYGFLSIFPVLLLIVATVSRVLADNVALRDQWVNAIVPEEFRATVNAALAALPTSGVALVIGLVALVLSSLGIVQTAHDTLNHVAGIPHRLRLSGIGRWIRVVIMLAVLLVGVAAIGAVTILTGAISDTANLQRAAEFFGILALAFLLMWAGVSLLLPRRPPFQGLWPAALLGSIAIALVLTLGSKLLATMISRQGPVYGSFATITGLFAFIALVSQALVWAAELAAVRRYRLWPRAVDANKPTEADKRAHAILTAEQERIPTQRNLAEFAPGEVAD